MDTNILILFVLLLFAFIFCSYFGKCGSREGMTSGTIYYGPNGTMAQIETETGNLIVTSSDGNVTTYSVSSTDSTTYYASNGASATITYNDNGPNTIQVKDSNGNVVLTLTNNPSTGVSTATTSNGTYDNYNHYNGTSNPTIYYGPDGGTAKVVQTPDNDSIVITYKNGMTEVYYIENGTNANVDTNIYYGPNGGTAKIITENGQAQAIEITTSNGSKVVYNGNNAYVYDSQDGTINQYDTDNNSSGTDYNTAYTNSYYGPNGGQVNTITGPNGNTYATYDSSSYYNSLPTGIPRSQIPPGDEDLYILKSQVVPPVCPKCPDPIIYDEMDKNKCPPCPACARCPEPSFSCEKVFNAKAVNTNYFPMPVLNDFSTFGM
jgi:hypothetical protein